MPYSYLKQIKYWLKSIFNIELDPLILLIITSVIILTLFFIYKPASSAVLITSFTGSYVEIMIILLYQVLFGYAYYITGVVFTIFMIGLSVGAWIGKSFNVKQLYSLLVKTELLVIIFTGLVLSGLLIIRYLQLEVFIHILLLLFVFIASFLVAVQFSIASKQNNKRISVISSNVYMADMLGGAFGAFAVTIVLIPVFGFINTTLIIIGLNLLSLIKVLVFKKQLLEF
ncbi:MAG: hypothetical protein Kow0068_20020 [Marinilabiliales bacterium]